jgi:hypothetical protein
MLGCQHFLGREAFAFNILNLINTIVISTLPNKYKIHKYFRSVLVAHYLLEINSQVRLF